jgi:cyclase
VDGALARKSGGAILERMRRFARRGFLEGCAAAAVGAVLGPPKDAVAHEPPVSLATTSLRDGLFLITGAGCNVVAMDGPEGALLVDGGLEAHSSTLVKAALEATRSRRVHALFNTHWHPEQTGSNERLGKSGALIIAHENTRLWLSRPIETDWLPQLYGPLPPQARPTKTTYTTDALTYGRRIDYGYLQQAHTDGDIYVHFPEQKLLVAGGVVSNEGWPLMDYKTGGWIAGLVAGYDKLLQVAGDDTRIVPANGPLLTRADLQVHRKMYFTIYDRLVQSLLKGLGADEIVATQPAKEFAAQWGNPDAFVERSYRSLWGHYAANA